MKSNSLSSYEGRQSHIPTMEMPNIEVFENVYKGKEFKIHFTIPEFTAICPKTGLPDFGTIEVTYIPNLYCVELKSLKEYILSYRNLGIFHENVVNRILEDIVKACDPIYIHVKGDFNPRGGIKTVVEREYKKFN